jgi:hypothetical protein
MGAECGGWVEKGPITKHERDGEGVQNSRGWSREFHHPDKPGCLVTLHVYPVSIPNDAVVAGFELGVRRCIQFIICEDIERSYETRLWNRDEYQTLDGYNELRSIPEAEEEAREWLEGLDVGNVYWNGERF